MCPGQRRGQSWRPPVFYSPCAPPGAPPSPWSPPHCPCHSGMASGPPSRSPPPQLLAEAHAAQEAYFSLLVFFLFLISLSLKEKSMKNFW